MMAVSESLEVGKTFSSLEELKSFFKGLEEELKIIVSIVDSETITKASRRVRWVREAGNPELYYKYVVYGCYKSGERESRSSGKRKRPSLKQNCPWKLLVTLQDKGDKKGKELVVKEVNNKHNHDVVQAEVDCHAKRRQLDEQSKEMARQALQLNVNKKLLQQKLKRETGNLVLLKDLTNMEQNMKAKASENIQSLSEINLRSVHVPRLDDFSKKFSEAEVLCAKLASALAMLPLQMFEHQLEQVKLMDQMVNEHRMCVVMEYAESPRFAENTTMPSQSTHTNGHKTRIPSPSTSTFLSDTAPSSVASVDVITTVDADFSSQSTQTVSHRTSQPNVSVHRTNPSGESREPSRLTPSPSTSTFLTDTAPSSVASGDVILADTDFSGTLPNLKLPSQMNGRGRPKNSERKSALNLPQKSKTCMKFENQPIFEKEQLILSWIINDGDLVNHVRRRKLLLEKGHIESSDLVNNAIIDDRVDLALVRYMFDSDAWLYLA